MSRRRLIVNCKLQTAQVKCRIMQTKTITHQQSNKVSADGIFGDFNKSYSYMFKLFISNQVSEVDNLSKMCGLLQMLRFLSSFAQKLL